MVARTFPILARTSFGGGLLAVVLLASACPPRPEPFERDAGMVDDAGRPGVDAGHSDSGTPDAGEPTVGDGGSDADAGADAGRADAGNSLVDAGIGDAGLVDDAGDLGEDGGAPMDASDPADSGSTEDAGIQDGGTNAPEPEPEPAPGPGVSGDRFTDVTDELGIDSVYYDRSVQDFYCQFVLQMGGGVALGDVNDDGQTDIFLTRYQQPAQLYLATAVGFVEDAAGYGLDFVTSGNGATFADVDDDGDLDLFVGSLSREPDRLYIQQANGQFVDETEGRIPTPSIPGACGNVFSVVTADVDKDGDLDLHTSQWNTTTNPDNSRSRLLINNGNGVFTNATLESGLGLSATYAYTTVFADVSNDGFPDALVSGDFGTSRYFVNEGVLPVRFTEVLSPLVALTDENGMGGAIGDFDGDGDFDWFVTSIFDPLDPCGGRGDSWDCTGNRLYRNDIDDGVAPLWADVTETARVREGGWGWGAVFVDFDNDGDEDIAHVNGYTANDDDRADAEQFFFQPGSIFENEGGVFTDVAQSLGFHDNGQGRGIVFFDYNGDGAQDVLVTNNKEGTKFFRNDLENPGAWLKVRLNATRSAPRGIGATVEVTRVPGATPMRRVIGANNTFLSAPDTVAHFGLGTATPYVFQVRVRWPNSASTTLMTNVEPNQTLIIPEPPF